VCHPIDAILPAGGSWRTTRGHNWSQGPRMRKSLKALLSPSITVLAPARPGFWPGVDDVLNAAVAARTALRVASGQARPVPDPPETFGDGLPCAIWT
jgi:hypothetical protein